MHQYNNNPGNNSGFFVVGLYLSIIYCIIYVILIFVNYKSILSYQLDADQRDKVLY